MALASTAILEIRTTGNAANGGGFNPGNANFATDLTATVANTTAPVVTSASYTFAAGDVGAWLFVKAGTNWIPGAYQIASVSGGAATLTATIGAAYLYNASATYNTVGAVATVASPTGGTWGVDYSMQDAAQVAYTDLVIDGSNNLKVTSAASPFGKNHVGNLLAVASGTGFTVQTVEVSSVTAGAATCNQALGTVGSTAGVGKLGGALATVPNLVGVQAASNRAFIKSGTYTLATGVTFTAAGTATSMCQLIGYAAMRGDITEGSANQSSRPQVVAGANMAALLTTGGTWALRNLIFSAGSFTVTNLVTTGGNNQVADNCKFSGFVNNGFNGSGSGSGVSVINCEATGGTSASGYGIFMGGTGLCRGNWSHNNAGVGIVAPALSVVADNVVNNNGSYGLNVGLPASVRDNTVYGNGNHGLILAVPVAYGSVIQGNIFSQNTGYGLYNNGTAMPALPQFDGNAYYSNTVGTRNAMDDVSAGYCSYQNARDVVQALTVDPFVAKGSADFRLNSTAGGGAVLKGTAPGGGNFGAAFASAADFGAIQGTSAGTYTAAANVRSGTDRGDGTTGTLVVPAAATVLATATFDNGTAGTVVLPAAANVRSGITFGPASGTTGTVTLPATTDVNTGVTYGAGGTEFTGALSTTGISLGQLQSELTARGLTSTLTTYLGAGVKVQVGTGAGQVNVSGGKVPATLAGPDVTGNLPADLQTIKSQAVTCAAGVTVLASVGTAAPATAQTGDAFARLGTPAGASIAADIQTRSTFAGGAVTAVTNPVVAASVTAPVTVGTVNDKTGYSAAATNLPSDYQQRGQAVTLPGTAPAGYGPGLTGFAGTVASVTDASHFTLTLSVNAPGAPADYPGKTLVFQSGTANQARGTVASAAITGSQGAYTAAVAMNTGVSPIVGAAPAVGDQCVIL